MAGNNEIDVMAGHLIVSEVEVVPNSPLILVRGRMSDLRFDVLSGDLMLVEGYSWWVRHPDWQRDEMVSAEAVEGVEYPDSRNPHIVGLALRMGRQAVSVHEAVELAREFARGVEGECGGLMAWDADGAVPNFFLHQRELSKWVPKDFKSRQLRVAKHWPRLQDYFAMLRACELKEEQG